MGMRGIGLFKYLFRGAGMAVRTTGAPCIPANSESSRGRIDEPFV
jgi:hypothetical protein